MKPSVYIETTIPSYLTAWRSRDLVRAAQQELTREWWDSRGHFDLYISQVVLNEAGAGDPSAAAKRLEALADIPVLQTTEEISRLSKIFLKEGSMPEKAAIDALHIATAVVYGTTYLLTWNCAHIANAFTRRKIERICRKSGYEPSVICTPNELKEP